LRHLFARRLGRGIIAGGSRSVDGLAGGLQSATCARMVASS